jgi:preprotein translocase subunit SecE
MADTPTSTGSTEPKKAPPSNSRMSDIQKRAERMANSGSKFPGFKVFFEEAWVELKKTSWPTKDVLIKSTTVVLALVAAVAVWVGILDYLLSLAMNRVLGG